jgi:sugar lactone lactonase YvrE
MTFSPRRFPSGYRYVCAAGTLTVLGFLILATTRFGAMSPSRVAVAAVSDRPAAAGAASHQTAGAHVRVVETYGKLPLSFEANQGQTENQVKFLSRGRGYTVFLTGDEAVLALRRGELTSPQHGGIKPPLHGPSAVRRRLSTHHPLWATTDIEPRTTDGLFPPLIQNPKSQIQDFLAGPESRVASPEPRAAVLRLKLVGANPHAKVTGLDPLPGKSNYFLGNDSKKWQTNVPNYAKAKCQNVYPGIDLVYYGNQGNLEHDFVVAPGADPKAVKFAIEGTESVGVNAAGDLVLRIDGGEVTLHKPLVHQSSLPRSPSDPKFKLTSPKFLDGHFILAANQVAFEIGAYDKTLPLVIDPVLSYSTYLGGGITDSAYGIAVDSTGAAYVTGYTGSLDFPTTTGVPQGSSGGAYDAFVTKLNASGCALIYSTYLGGSVDDLGLGIAVDSAGSAYVAGVTASSNFPTTPGAFQTTGGILNGGGYSDAFVTKLDPSGALVYSTYLGGTDTDYAEAIAVDPTGSVYVTGQTSSFAGDFPVTPNAFLTTAAWGQYAFVTKLNTTGSALVYSTYLGGSGYLGGLAVQEGAAIAVDSAGSAYVTGDTEAGDFPVTNGSYQTFPGVDTGGFMILNAFVTKLASDGSSLVYSTFLGGGGDVNGTAGTGIALGSTGSAVVTGFTDSLSFPTTSGVLQRSNHGGVDAFVAALNPSGSALSYSTYLGGAGDDAGYGLTLDSAGSIYLVGSTSSSNFPTTSAFQTNFAGQGINGCAEFQWFRPTFSLLAPSCGDTFVVKVAPGATQLVYSSYLGGADDDVGLGIAVDSAGSAYLAGGTASSNFPITPGVFQSSLRAPYPNTNAFIAKISSALGPAAALSPTALDFGSQVVGVTSAPQTVTLTNSGTADLTISTVALTGADASDFAISADTCSGATVTPSSTCAVSVTFSPTATGPRTGTLTVTDDASNSPQTVSLTGTGIQPSIAISSVSPSSVTLVQGGGAQVVTANLTRTGYTGSVSLSTSTLPTGVTATITQPGTGNSGSISLQAASNATLVSNQTITITASGSGVSSVTSTFSLTVNASATPTPAASLSWNNVCFPQGNKALCFGTQAVNATSEPQFVTVTNAGTAPLSFSASPVASGDFSVAADNTTTCTTTSALAVGASCVIAVTFTPVTTTTRTGTLNIADNDLHSPQIVNLTGFGMEGFPQSGPPTYFDNGLCKTSQWGCALTSTASMLTTFNANADPTSLDDFLTRNGGYCVGDCILNWTKVPSFMPTDTPIHLVGVPPVVNNIVETNPVQDLNTYLTAQVVQEQNRVILGLNYCQLIPNGECGPHFVFVTAPSGASDWEIYDPNSAVFGQHTLTGYLSGFQYTSPKTGQLTPIQFTVTGVKAYGSGTSGGLSVVACSPVELLIVDQQGRRLGNLGPGNDVFEIPSASYSRDYPLADDTGGGTTVGDPAGVKTAYIPNPLDGTYTVRITGTGAGPFTIKFSSVASDGSVRQTTVSGTTAPGSTATYDVPYSSTPGTPVTVTREPSGPVAGLSAGQVDFGSQLVGSTSSPQSVTLSNSGDSAMTIAGIAASGDFTQTNTCGTSIAAGAACAISIKFAPTATGARNGTVTIASNAPGSPHLVSLTGQGVLLTQGNITTVAGGGPNNVPAVSAGIEPPTGVTVDRVGNFYFASPLADAVYKVDALGHLTVAAGNGTAGGQWGTSRPYGGDGGPATSGQLDYPSGVAVDAFGNLFIAETYGGRIRRVDATTGIITTVAGGGTSGLGDGGPATAATLDAPGAVAVDASGNLFVADSNRIRRIDAVTGVITTVAGNGTEGFSGDGGPATNAELDFWSWGGGVAVDSFGNLFIADTNNSRIRRVDAATGIITTVAGGGSSGLGDGGPATAAELLWPTAVAVDTSGNLFITDLGNYRIRRVDATTGIITTVVGNGTYGFSGDGGPGTSAQLSFAYGVTVDASGALFVADYNNYRIRRIDAVTGIITTVAGNGTVGDGGPATKARLGYPSGVTMDGSGNLFIAEPANYRIRRVDTNTGIINTVAGNGTQGYSGDGGPATSAQLNFYEGAVVAVDTSGNLFVADTGNNRIRRVDATTGIITTVAGNGTAGFSGDGGPATNAELYFPHGVALNSSGSLFIADTLNSVIRRVDATTGIITTVAGNGTWGYSGDGGPATAAHLLWPQGLAVDAFGNLFITDMGNQRIRRVDATTSIITTVAGNGTDRFSGDGGPATSAELCYPSAVAVDDSGNLFIADTYNNRVRQVNLPPFVALSASTLAFSSQPVGGTSAPQTITLTNTGYAQLNLAGINITGDNSGDFAYTSTCGGTLAAAQNCTISVAFTPTAGGTRTGMLTVTDNASDSPQTVSLSGTGTGPGINLSPSSVSFGNQLVGTTSPVQTVTLTNSGTATLNISAVTISGTNSGDFSRTNHCGATVAAGLSCMIDVTFTPTATGSRTATLSVSSDAYGSPHTVVLSGTGTDFALGTQAGGSTSATVNAGQTATYNLQVAPTGFSGSVALSCAWTGSQPRGTNCTVSPTSVNLDGTNAARFTVTVTTTARSLAGPRPDSWPPARIGHLVAPLVVCLLGLKILMALAAPRRRRVYASLAVSMLFVLLWAACGGGGGGGAAPTPPQTGTPAGTYTLTITAGASGVSRTATLTLKVN